MTDRASGDAGGAQAIITLKVAPGSEAEFRDLEGRLGAACQGFPGFLASEMIQPVAGVQEARIFPARPPYQPEWATAYSFDTQAHLQNWLDSPVRREWLEKGGPLFEQTAERRLAGGFGNWFAAAEGGEPAAVPPGW